MYVIILESDVHRSTESCLQFISALMEHRQTLHYVCYVFVHWRPTVWPCLAVCACVTCEQLIQGVVPGLCVFSRCVVQVQRVLLQPPPSPPAVEQSHTEHSSSRLLSRSSPPLHLHCKHILQQQHTWLHHTHLTCGQRASVNAQHLYTTHY